MDSILGSLCLCLSSADTEQYRRDVLRSLAMPPGAILQFRYSSKYVDEEILSRTGSPVAKVPVLIAYVDSDRSQRYPNPQIVPTRFAQLVSTRRFGTRVALSLEL